MTGRLKIIPMELCQTKNNVSVLIIRDWSLITRRRATKREEGSCEVLSQRKGAAGKALVMLKGGHKKFWGSF